MPMVILSSTMFVSSRSLFESVILSTWSLASLTVPLLPPVLAGSALAKALRRRTWVPPLQAEEKKRKCKDQREKDARRNDEKES
jgi:hypothetical protein